VVVYIVTNVQKRLQKKNPIFLENHHHHHHHKIKFLENRKKKFRKKKSHQGPSSHRQVAENGARGTIEGD
jgi:hypothetical protein